ncbi:MAG: nucleotidyltransferase domain-containing protein [Acidobacteriota bacterium]
MRSASGDDLIGAVRTFFATPPAGMAAVYVFGSAARGQSRPESDVDVAVLFDQDPPRTLKGLRFDLADALAQHLGRNVDLIVLNRAPADLVHRVLRDGVLVCEPDRSARVSFEVRRRNEYFDLDPIRRQYRRVAGTGSSPP